MSSADAELLAAWEGYLRAARTSFLPLPSISTEEFMASPAAETAAGSRIEQLTTTTAARMVIKAKLALIHRCPALKRPIVFDEPLPADLPDECAHERLAWNALKAYQSVVDAEDFEREHGGLDRLP